MPPAAGRGARGTGRRRVDGRLRRGVATCSVRRDAPPRIEREEGDDPHDDTPRIRGRARPIGRHVIPKTGGGMRRLVVLDPRRTSRRSRGASLGRCAGPRSVTRKRVAREPAVGWDPRGEPVLEPWTRARRRWRREVARLAGEAALVAVTDVRECYAIDPPERGKPPAPHPGDLARRCRCDRIVAARVPRRRRRGAPDRAGRAPRCSPTSCLSAGDDALRSTGAPFVRWVDDVAIFAPDRRTRADGAPGAPPDVGVARPRAARGEDRPARTIPRELAARLGTMSNVPPRASALR